MSTWPDPQPIETAPKGDNIRYATRILAWWPLFGGGWYRTVWDAETYRREPRPYWSCNELENSAGLRAVRANQPTLWLPLPPAPELI